VLAPTSSGVISIPALPVLHCVSLCVTACHCVSLCVTVCPCVPVSHCVSLCVPVLAATHSASDFHARIAATVMASPGTTRGADALGHRIVDVCRQVLNCSKYRGTQLNIVTHSGTQRVAVTHSETK